MTGAAQRPIREGIFRFSPDYELVPLDGLSPENKRALERFGSIRGFHAMLVPRASTKPGIKLVCRDTANLIQALGRPAPLPCGVEFRWEGCAQQNIAALVADGLLEIEQGGKFIAGPEAYSLLFESHPPAEPAGPIARISRAALEYAEALAIDDAVQLASRLYAYNRIPLSAAWMRRLPTRRSVESFLGRGLPSHHQKINESWGATRTAATNSYWFLSRMGSPHGTNRTQACYKLYISPHPEDLPAVLEKAIEGLGNSEAFSFKVAAEISGILRPDKFVAYFPDLDSLRHAALKLAPQLSGCRPHGVPFTASLTPDGLLSWGLDPPQPSDAEVEALPQSWRVWITDRLASALIAAGQSLRATVPAWQFALERLRLHGVNPDTWAPDPGFSFQTETG